MMPLYRDGEPLEEPIIRLTREARSAMETLQLALQGLHSIKGATVVVHIPKGIQIERESGTFGLSVEEKRVY